tara:strand:+ start:40 stop:639 length:600 start_codon:yes stop_codon:yes gene_type:complete
MELIEKILNLYLSFADTISLHFYKFSIAFTLISIVWISLVGIVTPVLVISVLAFGYYGIIVSLLSLILGSIINFFMATKTKSAIKKIQHKKPFFSEDPFLIFLIFRLIPGIPYLIKNLSVIFFKLNFKSFFLAVIISDTPQIVIFTFFFKRLIDSSNEFLITQDFNRIFDQMFFPILILILFVFFIFFLKKKKSIVYKK